MYRNVNMDSPYAANAPMWSDFGSSPNLSSDYFDVVHPETETPFINVPDKLRSKRHDFNNGSFLTVENGLAVETSESTATFLDTIDTISMTPVKVISPKAKKGKPQVIKETTVADVLNSVLGIASSATKQRRKPDNLSKTQIATESTTAKPKRITRSMALAESAKTPTQLPKPSSRSRRSVAPQKTPKSTDPVDLSAKNDAGVPISKIIRTPVFNYKKSDPKDIVAPEKAPDIEEKIEEIQNLLEPLNLAKNLDLVSSTPGPRPTSSVIRDEFKKPAVRDDGNPSALPVEPAPLQDCPPPESDVPETDDDYEEVFEPVEDAEAYLVYKNRHVNKRKSRGGQPTVLTSHARRRSSLKPTARRLSNQYISLAEAIKKFEKGTPDRFHTVSKNPKPKVLQTLKQQILKRTVPISPALTSKNRVRRNVVLSRAELEEIELRKMKEHKIRANPIPTNILQAPQPLKSVPKKPLTSQKPFHLSRPKKPLPPKESIPSTSHVTKKPLKKVVPTVVNSESGVTVAETQIMHFGIPVSHKAQIGSAKKKTTQPMPFNFEARNKLFMSKKEEKLKKLQSEEELKSKVEFHARPMPLSAKKPVQKQKAESHEDLNKSKPRVVPFSFEARDKELGKKKEEIRKKIDEEAKKARSFHANPAPHFRPVLVRGRSKENVKGEVKEGTVRNRSVEVKKLGVIAPVRGKSAENLRTFGRERSKESMKNTGPAPIQKIASMGQLSNSQENQENRPPNRGATAVKKIMPTLKPKLKSLPSELHSDKRARMRKEFDDQLRVKDVQKEEKRKRDQVERLAREQEEIKELRKKAERKARPMPVYKPMAVVKSTKPLTAPASPAWAKAKP